MRSCQQVCQACCTVIVPLQPSKKASSELQTPSLSNNVEESVAGVSQACIFSLLSTAHLIICGSAWRNWALKVRPMDLEVLCPGLKLVDP